MAGKFSVYYNMFGGIVGVLAGIILLLIQEWVWAIIGLVAGGFLIYWNVKKLKAGK